MTSDAAQRSLLPMLSMTPSHGAVLAPSAPPKEKHLLSCSVESAPGTDSPTGALTPVVVAAVRPQRSQFSPPPSLDEVPESRVARAHARGLFDSDDEDYSLFLRAMFLENDSEAVTKADTSGAPDLQHLSARLPDEAHGAGGGQHAPPTSLTCQEQLDDDMAKELDSVDLGHVMDVLAEEELDDNAADAQTTPSAGLAQVMTPAQQVPGAQAAGGNSAKIPAGGASIVSEGARGAKKDAKRKAPDAPESTHKMHTRSKPDAMVAAPSAVMAPPAVATVPIRHHTKGKLSYTIEEGEDKLPEFRDFWLNIAGSGAMEVDVVPNPRVRRRCCVCHKSPGGTTWRSGLFLGLPNVSMCNCCYPKGVKLQNEVDTCVNEHPSLAAKWAEWGF